MEFTISGDTEKTTYSVDADNISSSEGNPMGNSRIDSDDIRYRFITCHLKERLGPESLVSTVSKSASGVKNCLEATLSVYAPSLSSMAPHRLDESKEILSTIVDNASSVPKEEKGTETSTWPVTTTIGGRAYSTSTSAQTCLVDYELFKGFGCNTKFYRKDFVIEETLTNGIFSQNPESSSILG